MSSTYYTFVKNVLWFFRLVKFKNFGKNHNPEVDQVRQEVLDLFVAPKLHWVRNFNEYWKWKVVG